MISFGPPRDRAERREWWRRYIRRQQESNVSVAEFCRRHGLKPVTFYAWKQRLEKAPARDQRIAGKAPSALAAPAFVPVSLRDSTPSGQLEVVLGNASVVRLTGAIDPELLRVAIHAAGRRQWSGRGDH